MTDLSMLYDAKHLLPEKVPIYAKNIIIAMLKAYGIKDKQELFSTPGGQQHTTFGRPNIQNRMMNIANYSGDEIKRHVLAPNNYHSNNNYLDEDEQK